ncbi:MAG: CHASE2 domain-containing protein, partial [Thermoanaerobaculia bacterium]
RWRRAELPRRAFLAAVLAALVPVAGLLLPHGLPTVERWADDLRFRAAPARPPDPRILLVTIDDASLAAGAKPLAGWADELGHTLDRVFAAGARGVAIDFVLPDSWSASQGFSELVLRHSEALTLAAFSKPEGNILGTGSIAGLTTVALGPQRSSALFGFVNLDEDSDGVVRHGRLGFRDSEGGIRPSWAVRAARAISSIPATYGIKSFWIDPRIDRSGFARISWQDVPVALATRPWVFRDRLVLVGGDFVDDVHRISQRSGEAERVPGLVLQALMVDTIAAGLPVREATAAPFLAGAALWIGLATAAVLLVRKLLPALAVLLGSLLLYLYLSIPVFQRTGLLLPVTAPLLPALGALALAVILRRALSPIPSWRPTS